VTLTRSRLKRYNAEVFAVAVVATPSHHGSRENQQMHQPLAHTLLGRHGVYGLLFSSSLPSLMTTPKPE
jgi:hypothetical protein